MGRHPSQRARQGVSRESTMRTANAAFVEQSRRFWQQRMGRELADEDVREIVNNTTGFIRVLAEWSHADDLSTHPPGGASRGAAAQAEGRPR